tara:strand:- start:180 stop:575 length:396 start_codon:yes stop_codon:yes gene_type:complete
MTFKTMDKPTAGLVGKAAMKAMEEVMKSHGVKVERGGGTYDPAAGTLGIKFTFTLDGADGKEVADFNRYNYQFPAYEIGATFKSNGHIFTLAGYKPRSSKRPFVAKRSDGKEFVFGWDALEQKLGDKDAHA